MSNSSSNVAGASSAAIQQHYDVGNDFYSLWLDPTLTYSCAMWRDESDTLEQAQRRKLEYMAQLACQKGARRVLDIGCGWGGMMRHLIDEHGIQQVTGITLSEEQRDYIQGLHLDGGEAWLEHWQDHTPDETYDAIISIGAFEHFVKAGMSTQAKIEAYRRFFEKCHALVSPGAPLVLQTIAYGSSPDQSEGSKFFGEVFPESDCPKAVEILEASHGLFELQTMRNDREDYVKTCKSWLHNLKRNEQHARADFGPDLIDFYKKYLSLSAISFHTRNRTLLRCWFERI